MMIIESVLLIALIFVGLRLLWKLLPTNDQVVWKEIYKPTDDPTLKNNRLLMLIELILFICYAVTLFVVFIIGTEFGKLIGGLFFIIVVLLTLMSAFGLALVRNNYEVGEKGSKQLLSFGSSLFSAGLNILVGTIAIGLLTLILK